MGTSNRGSQQLDSQSTAGQTPRYATFNSTKVLICGYPDDEVSALAKCIEQEGGKVLKKYYKTARPDVIVCGTVADRNCKEARRAWQDAVPVVTKDWVEACAKQKAQVSFGPYKLGALVGLEISATNFQAKERVMLQKLVEQAGGTYSAELFKGRTTHLMCKNGSGKKYQAAVQWRSVHVVTDAWLKDSAALGYPALETNYKVEPVLEAKQTTETTEPAAAPAALAPQPHAVSESVMFGDKQQASAATSKQQQQQAAEPLSQQQQQQQEASSKSRAKRSAAAAAAASIEQQAGGKTRRSSQRSQPVPPDPAVEAADPQEADHNVADAAADADAGGAPPVAAAAAAAVPVNGTDSRLAALGVTDPESAPMFLERVVLWWCGIPEGSPEHWELQTILHAYAGVRFPDIQDITTHLMIGKHTKMEELKAVQQYLSTCNRRIEVVSVAWLELCHREQRLVPVDSRCRLQISSLMGGATGAQGALGAGPAGLRTVSSTGTAGGGGGGVFANTASRGGFPEAEKQDGVAWVPEYWHEQPTDPLKLFDGCYFTLAAVQSHQAEHERALGHIRRLGGKVFTADSTKPPPRWPKVFAICPASLTRETEAALMAADASFRLVHPSCRVTNYWMDTCVKNSELQRVSARNPMLAPMRFALPLRDFANVSVAVTGYKDGQRGTIEKLVLLLGGSFCKTLGRQQRPTHLMLPRWGPDSLAAADGSASSPQQLPDSTVKKIAYAMKHRVEMVVSEWLLDCAVEGRRVQENLHRPEGDVSLLELPAGGATQAAGATQLPVTQLQQTQTQAMPPVSRPAPAPGQTGARSLAALLASQAPLPRPPPANRPAAAAPTSSTAVPGGSSEAAAAAAPAPAPAKSNWFTANRVSNSTLSSQQQQQLAAAAAAVPAPAEQQGLPVQHTGSRPVKDKVLSPRRAAVQQKPVTPGRSGRKRAAAGAAGDAGMAPDSDQLDAGGVVGEAEQQDVAQLRQKRQCKQQQHVDAMPDIVGVAAMAAGHGAAAAVAAAAEAGTEGHDAALTDVLSMLATYNNKDANIPASQALAGDILQLPDTLLSAGRVASGGGGSGAGGAGSGGGGSGGVQSGGQGIRSRRRAGTLSRALSGGGSGGTEVLEGAAGVEVGSGAAGCAGVQTGAKRLRRSSGSAKAAGGGSAAAGEPGQGNSAGAAMLPPARKAVGGAEGGLAAGAAQAGAGSSRYGTRRAGINTAPTDVPFEPSQQVGYDVGDRPETLLGAGGRGQRRTAEDDAQKQAHMLARLSSLRSRSGS